MTSASACSSAQQCSQALIAKIETAPGEHAEHDRRDESGISDAYMRHGGAAKKRGDQDTAIDRCSWDQIAHGAAEFEQADECALRETELVHPLVDENRCVRELQQCTQQERQHGQESQRPAGAIFPGCGLRLNVNV